MSSLPLLFSFFFFFLVELGFELSAWCLQSKAQPSPKKLNKGQNLELGLVGNIKMGKKEKKKKTRAGCQWLTSIILATWETEIRKIEVRGQAGQIVFETFSPN
jgi:hypothetical protein